MIRVDVVMMEGGNYEYLATGCHVDGGVLVLTFVNETRYFAAGTWRSAVVEHP